MSSEARPPLGMHGNVTYMAVHSNVVHMGMHGNVAHMGMHGNRQCYTYTSATGNVTPIQQSCSVLHL